MKFIKQVNNEYHFLSEEKDDINPVKQELIDEMFNMINLQPIHRFRLIINHSHTDKNSTLFDDHNVTLILT